MIEFNRFYRYNAVLKKAQLYSPPVINLPLTGLPFWSTIHFASNDKNVLGMTKNHPVVRGLGKESTVVAMFNIPNPALIPGKFIQRAVRFNDTVSKYIRTVPGWHRGDLEPSLLKQKDNVVVYNYGLYHQSIGFQENSLSYYHEIIGFWNQVIGQVATDLHRPKPKSGVDGLGGRNQLILIDMPAIIPSVKLLTNYAATENNTGHISKLGTSERIIIAELWKWLGGSENTVFSKLTVEDTKKVDLLFTHISSCAMINLYVLRQMVKDMQVIKGKDKPSEIFTGQDMAVLSTLPLQKALIMMLVSLKTKVDAGIISEVVDEAELIGNGQAEADEKDYDDLEAAILGDEDDDAPTEKAITQQFLTDTTETGLDMESKLEKRIRSKVAEKLKGDNPKLLVDEPSNELEDIFSGSDVDNTEYVEKHVEDTLAILDEVNDTDTTEETIQDNEEESFTTVETSDGQVTTTNGNVAEEVFKNVSYKPYETQDQAPEVAFMRLVMEDASKGILSAAEVRRFETISKKWRTTIKDPYGGEGTLETAAAINPEDLLIPENNKLAEKIPGVFDQSYLESSHDKMHRHYNSKILRKDILNNAVQLMKAGYAIDNYEVATHNDIVDSYEIHTVRLVPIRGKPSTIKFRVPIVTPNGTFKAGGNINRMRVQRADIPIRKVSPGEVALTSYHSKMWIRRSPLVAFNFDKWIEKTITSLATNPDNILITNVSYGNCFNSDIEAPLMYTSISRYFSSFRIGKYQFMWDSRKNDTFFGKEVNDVAKRYTDNQVMCGKGENSILWMDNAGNIFEAPMGPGEAIPIGTIPSLLNVDPYKIPVQSADLKIFSKAIPIGIALAFWVGLGNLLTTIGAKYRRVPARSLLGLQPNEFYVKFQDETLVFDRDDEVTSLIMSGWNEYHAFIKFYSVYDFDKVDTFGRFFYETKIEGRYENELNIIRQLWIDPITEGELIRLKEPTDMVNLFISGVKKLTYDKHPDQMDGLFQRDRGYERISGFVYDNMVRSVRGHRNRRFMRDAALDMPPEVIWYDILKDQTTGIAEFSNPIHSLKEQEVVVFRGAGGRSSQSMMAGNRKAHRSNVGRDSEATVDSGDVATVIYTTANPNYDSVRGTVRYTDKPNENVSRSFGTSQLLAAAGEYDD